MSTVTEITRLQTARNTIRDKLMTFGLAASTDKLDDLANEIDNISYQGAISASVQEGDTYTIPEGYHNGAGTVSGIAGGGNYTLQARGPITPTKSQISVSADAGYYGLSSVLIGAIPEAYQNVSSVTATAADVLSPKVIVGSDGATITGEMTNNGAVSATLDTTTTSYTVPAGYHNGSGAVSIVTEAKTVSPSTSDQTITPASGKVLRQVTVSKIPKNYGNCVDDDAAAANILSGKKAHSYRSDTDSAYQVTGTMPNNGAVSVTLDATTDNQSYTVPLGYHDGSGTVSITLEQKSATPSTSSQTITPTSGKVLSQVTVDAIPSAYQDVTNVDAAAGDVLSGKIIVDSTGAEVTGSMPDNGAVSATLDTTTTSYTVPAGYHNGSGTVSIVTESKEAVPSTNTQRITPTSGKVLSQVTVHPIPANYADTTNGPGADDNAVAADVLYGKLAHSYDSTEREAVKLTGSMPNNGAVSATLDTTTTSYTVPTGYHNGSGTVSITLEQKSATPSTSSQTITPTSGKVLSQVTVAAIPAKYGDTTGDDAIAANLLAGKFAHTIQNGSAVQIEGTMANNGSITGSINGLTTTSYTVPAGYHNGSGTVSLTSDIEDALAAI